MLYYCVIYTQNNLFASFLAKISSPYLSLYRTGPPFTPFFFSLVASNTFI